MGLESLLKSLDHVKKRPGDKWQARCPAHKDTGPSLSIKELDDGRVLIHCHAGCGAAEILDAIGLNFSDLYPPPIHGNSLGKTRRSFNANDVLAGIAFEILVAWNFSKRLAAGHTLTDAERTRLLMCATRLQNGLEMARG